MKIPNIAALTTAAVLAFGAATSSAYDRPNITNHTPYAAKVVVKYSGCSHDEWEVPPGTVQKDNFIPSGSHSGSSRGGCLIREVNVGMRNGPPLPMYNYSSSGTSFSQFHLLRRGGHYRVMSDHEVTTENTDADGSPGFKITNKTAWPLSLSLDQLGCLYYETIQPGQTWNKTTGAVWFTINAKIQPDGRQKSANDVALECVMPVAEAVVEVVTAVFTAGAGLPLLEAAEEGAKEAVEWAVKATAEALLDVPHENGAVKRPGEYAGPPYPFRCTHKPAYEIHGGWGRYRNGPTAGTALQIYKVAGCENDDLDTPPQLHDRPDLVVPAGVFSADSHKVKGTTASWVEVGDATHSTSAFAQIARSNTWIQGTSNGEVTTYRENRRDEWSVYLEPQSDKAEIILNLWTREVLQGGKKIAVVRRVAGPEITN